MAASSAPLRGGRQGPQRGRSILAAYLRLDLALHGVERARAPSESLGEFAGRLGGFVATPREVAAAISCLERETYGIDPPSLQSRPWRSRSSIGSAPVQVHSS